MVRWEPGSADRLREAAFELFLEQGFEGTTVTQIADRAGLNRRTFFHHFADKGEVVFADLFDEVGLGEIIVAQPKEVDPVRAAIAGLRAVAEQYESQRPFGVTLGRMLAASPELRSRELVKRSSMVARVRAALLLRRTAEDRATVAAWTAVAMFFLARDRWHQPEDKRTLSHHLDVVLASVAGGTDPLLETSPRLG